MNDASEAQVAQSIVLGVGKAVAGPVSLEEFHRICALVLKEAEPSKASVLVALAEGEAFAMFPRLSSQVIRIKEGRVLTRADFRIASAGGLTVVGERKKDIATMLVEDIVDHRLSIILLSIALIAVWMAGIGAGTLETLANAITLGSATFFALFVLFGAREVLRSGQQELALFKAGTLQAYLDADRFLVRLSVAAFFFSIAAQVLIVTQGQLIERLGDWRVEQTLVGAIDSAWTLATVVCVYAAALGMLLCFHAASGYLLDRAANNLLLQSASKSLAEAREAHLAGQSTQEAEGAPHRSGRPSD